MFAAFRFSAKKIKIKWHKSVIFEHFFIIKGYKRGTKNLSS